MYLNTDCHPTCAGIISGSISANNNDVTISMWSYTMVDTLFVSKQLGLQRPLLGLHQDKQVLNFRLVAALSTNVICLGPVGLVENK